MPKGSSNSDGSLSPDQNVFIGATMRTNFMLNLSHPMIEMLSAIADDVRWDRSRYSNLHYPDNWFATEASLTKRGLIRRKPRIVLENQTYESSQDFVSEKPNAHWRSCCELTEIGKAVVELLKVGGVFVQAEDALLKENGNGKA